MSAARLRQNLVDTGALAEARMRAGSIPTSGIKQGDLSTVLDNADKSPEASREGANPIHASNLAGDWCPRRHAICFRHPESVTGQWRTPTSSQRIVWALGRTVETFIRNNLIRVLGADRCIGSWSCPCGTVKFDGPGKPDFVCSVCKNPPHYGELKVQAPGVPVSGSPDFQFLTGRERKTINVVEIKSEKLDSFLARSKADATHETQGALYIELIRRTCPPSYHVSPHGFVIYGAKDCPRPGVSPYKDYKFEAPTRQPDTILDSATSDLGRILNGDATAPLPPRLAACNSPTSSRAKQCGACNLCFVLNS